MFVQLTRARMGNFRRTVRDDDGRIVNVLEWRPGDVLELTTPAELQSIRDDLGHALIEVVSSEMLGKHVTRERQALVEPRRLEQSTDTDAPEDPDRASVESTDKPRRNRRRKELVEGEAPAAASGANPLRQATE